MTSALVNHSMDRRMTGAKSWDMPIEVGRRFGGDESELHEEQDSTLNLDFELDGSRGPLSSSKSWDEGTRQFGDDSAATTTSQNIEEDEFLAVGEQHELELDLGLNDENDQSIEVGRRAEANDTMAERPIDFDLDLGIGKDVDEDIDEMGEEQDLNIQEGAESEPTPNRRNTKDPTLANVHQLETDGTTELPDDYIKSNPGRNLFNEIESSSRKLEDKLTAKRIWSDMAQSLSYLPASVVENILKFQPSKRQKVAQDDSNSELEPEMDISLGLNDDLVRDNETEASEPPQMDLANIDIVQESNEEAVSAQQVAEGTLDILPTQESEFDTSMEENRKKEAANLFTTSVAQVLGDTLEQESKDTIQFANLLENFHLQDEDNKTEPMTKKDACSVFFSMLSLATDDCIELEQQETFGTINIKSKPNFYRQYIS